MVYRLSVTVDYTTPKTRKRKEHHTERLLDWRDFGYHTSVEKLRLGGLVRQFAYGLVNPRIKRGNWSVNGILYFIEEVTCS